LFLEGIEVACTSAQVSCGINQPASAQIEIPYAVEATNLLPRTLVHLFYAETSYSAGKVDAQGKNTAELDYGDATQWKLLFAGEVISISFSKAGGARANYLMCQDFSSYWQAAQLYWGTGNNSANAYKKVLFMGGTQLTTGAQKVRNGSVLADLLAAKPTSIPTLPGVLGGIVSLLEAASGVYNTDKKYRGVNDFLTQAELRLHLSRLIYAHPEDDTSETFLQYGDLRTYFRRLTASVSSTSSFMDIVNIFMTKIHHVWSSIAAPPFIKSGMQVKVGQSLPASKVAAFDKELGEWAQKIQKTRDLIGTTLDEAGRNPKKDDNAGNYALVENPIKDAGKLEVKYRTDKHEDFNKKMSDIGLYDGQATKSDSGFGPESTNQTKIAAYSEKVTKKLNAIRPNKTNLSIAEGLQKAREAITDLRRIATSSAVDDVQDGTTVYTNHTSSQLIEAQKKLDAALEQISKGTSVPMVVKYKTVNTESRLAMFLFTPDLFMVPPPKCNVLFPDHYVSVTFGRAWLNEPTRLWLFGQTQAGSETSQGYFSPNTSILSGPKAVDAATAVSNGVSFLMKHELFTGPIPALEAIGDIGVFKKLHSKQLKQSQAKQKDAKKKVADPKGSEFTGQARYSPQEHMQRAANYLFFAKRFATRTMNVNAKFCPQLVPGLPMLLLDPPIAESDLLADTVSILNGQHYVGLISQIQHTVQTNGASTAVQLVKCRYHDEGLDIFEQKEGDLKERTGNLDYSKRVVTYKKKATPPGKIGRVAESYESKQMLDDIAAPNSPGEGYVEKSVEYTQENSTTKGSNAEYASKTTLWRNSKTGKEVTVTVKRVANADFAYGYSQPAPSAPFNSPYVTGGNQGPIVVPQFEVTTSTIEKSVKQKSLNFTFEATTIPPWFAAVYQPANIGTMFYKQFLGCASVIDDPLIKVTGETFNATDETFTYSMETSSGTRDIKLRTEYTVNSYSTTHAANQLAELWKSLRDVGANLPLFIDTYTERNHATMLDIMGDINPYFRPKFSALGDKPSKIGFHGEAYGEVTDMLSAITGSPLEEEPTIPRMPSTSIKPPTLRKVSPQADPRKERYVRVKNYNSEIAAVRTSSTGGN
jgi:hypothetical protein